MVLHKLHLSYFKATTVIGFVQDVCLSSPRVAFEFYRAARDALLLYEVVIPVKVSTLNLVLQNLPR